MGRSPEQGVATAERGWAAPLPLAVRPLGAADDAAWERFVETAPEASFFHRLGWRRIITETLGHRAHYRTAWRGDRLVGILPLIELRSRLFGTSLVSLGFTVYGGIVAEDQAAATALAAEAAALGQALGVDYVELRQRETLALDWTTRSDLYFTFCRRLAASSEANLKAVPRKKRADLRKALANPALKATAGADFATFLKIYGESLRNLGTPVLPRRFYAAIVAEFGAAVELSVVEAPAGPVAALMTFFFKDRAMPYYGGAIAAARPLHAYDLLYWSLMERAVARGTPLFDFGRSKRGTGAFDYKTHWGFTPEPLHYQYRLLRGTRLPENNPLNPKYRLMIRSWQRLPLPVANTLGPFIARQLG